MLRLYIFFTIFQLAIALHLPVELYLAFRESALLKADSS